MLVRPISTWTCNDTKPLVTSLVAFKPIFIWVQHVTELNDIGFSSLSSSYLFRLSMLLNLRMSGLIAH